MTSMRQYRKRDKPLRILTAPAARFNNNAAAILVFITDKLSNRSVLCVQIAADKQYFQARACVCDWLRVVLHVRIYWSIYFMVAITFDKQRKLYKNNIL